MAKDKPVLVKTVQIHAGLDLIGSRLSVQAKKGNVLTEEAMGIRIVSGETGRVVVIPYANVKGYELLLEKDAAPQNLK